ncbi:MAG TPA: rRNA maturation RNase YbeY [Gammaproteobacteria bacterium]
MSRGRLRVAVQRAVACPWLPDAASIRRWAAAAAPGHGGELTVRIVDEAESATLNETYRRKRGPTNVLAFPVDGVPPLPDEPVPLGDLVICAPVVEREAAEQGKTVAAHLAHLVVHGTLHLLGHDHEDEAAARVMEDREREILAAFGFDDPYRSEKGA